MYIKKPTIIKACGNIPKVIEEFVGNVNTNTSEVSIARMVCPSGWEEPGQTPEFDEYTIVLKGKLKAETRESEIVVGAGEAYHAEKDQWVRYSCPFAEDAEYVSVCLPAFSPDTVHRDE